MCVCVAAVWPSSVVTVYNHVVNGLIGEPIWKLHTHISPPSPLVRLLKKNPQTPFKKSYPPEPACLICTRAALSTDNLPAVLISSSPLPGDLSAPIKVISGLRQAPYHRFLVSLWPRPMLNCDELFGDYVNLEAKAIYRQSHARDACLI